MTPEERTFAAALAGKRDACARTAGAESLRHTGSRGDLGALIAAAIPNQDA